MTPDEVEAIQRRYARTQAPMATMGESVLCHAASADDVPTLLAALAEAQRERDELRQHILDIDAHATPYGDLPDEPGWVGTYLLTAGALHRALGKIGHSAPKCQAEADLKLTQQAIEEYRESWRAATQATLAECERLRSDLAEAQCREELMRPVVEAVRPMIARWRQQGYRPDSYWATDDSHALVAVWDTYETQTGGTE